MMREAESHSDEDKKRKEEIETRNQADQAVYVGDKTLRESGEKLGAAERAAIESAINDLKSAIEQNDIPGMKRRMEALNQAQHKAAEAMYRAASGQAAGSAGSAGPDQQASSGPASNGDVIDAEVVEEEKK
jgi:molecular chaperone DnaK